MQTELSAINSLLVAIGDSPQNTINFNNPDVQIAQSYLDIASIDFQSEGWWFNRETWAMALDTTGKQAIPVNCLYVNSSNSNWVKRGSYLYDKENHTYDFSEQSIDSSMQLIMQLPYEEMPGICFNYIVNMAKIQFLVEMESELEKAKAASNIAQKQYIQIKRLHLRFSDPVATQTTTARKLLDGIQMRD